jgi:nucleotide-binding universal stress UspA family protein
MPTRHITEVEWRSKERGIMYSRIMVPLDGSELAECVLPHVETLVKGDGAKEVILVRAAEPVYVPTGGDFAFSEERIEDINSRNRKAAQDYLVQIMKRLDLGPAAVRTEVLKGRAADTLAEYAAKHDVDLIVIATHGRAGVSRWVMGSVADRLLRSSSVPVLMVRSPGCFPGA